MNLSIVQTLRVIVRVLPETLPVRELHVDHYLAVASVLGLARGYAWPLSLTQQCAGQHESSIPHWDFWNVNPKMLLPSAPLWLVLLTLLLLLTLISTARR